ncbi:MAG: polysaccharide pyruvyl transferase family protein [Hyphomonadaceae bacterium]
MTRPLRICLWGQFGTGNFGNDASLEAMLLFLRRAAPDAAITVVCSDPDRVARHFNVRCEPMTWEGGESRVFQLVNRLGLKLPQKAGAWLDARKRARAFDVFIIPGTGILDDFGTGPFGLPFDVYRWTTAAKAAGARVAVVSIGAGPIRNALSRHYMTSAAKAACFRTYRDRFSLDYMQAHGVSAESDAVAPDIAFSLPRPPLAPPAGKLTIGLGVMLYRGWGRRDANADAIYSTYIETLAAFCEATLASGKRIRLLVGQDSDARAVADLTARLGPRDNLIATPQEDMHAVLREIAQCDLVVATRFHNVVAALKLARPTVSLSYQEKNDVLLAEMGLARFRQHVEEFSVETLLAHVEELTANRAQYEAGIKEAVARFEAALAAQEERLRAEILS